MYYHYDMEFTMKHVTQYMDLTLIRKSLIEMEATRKELKRKQAVLRTRCCRLRKIINDINQLDLPLEGK